MIAPLILLAALIAREPVVPVDRPAAVADSWLCVHVSVFYCPIFPQLGEPAPLHEKHVVKPRRP
jgi:hypothetical protein